MPSEKRARQRAMRQVKVAEVQRRAKRMKMVRRVLGGLFVAGIVILLVVLLSSKPAKKTAASATTTTSTSTSTTSSLPSTTAPGIATVTTPVAPTCPPVSGSTKRYINFTSAPGTCISSSATYEAIVKTDVGSFTIKLLTASAPTAVNNFVFLSRYHFYDSTIFHRVIPGFMDQGGDPTGTGTGGPGYSWTGNAPTGSCQSTNSCYPVGAVAMANSGALSSNGSQFFIMAGTSSPLPASYTLFGTVVSGMSVVEKINADGNANASANGVPPRVTHHIVNVTIVQS